MRTTLALCMLAAALSTFGTLGCGSAQSDQDDDIYQYGTSDVRAALEGTWIGTMTVDGRAPAPMRLTLAYAAADLHTLCEARTLSRGSLGGDLRPQCMRMSSMNVTGALTAPLPLQMEADGLAVRGVFSIPSVTWIGRGDLWIDANGHDLNASLTDGTLTGTAVVHGARLGDFTLTREAR